MFLSLTLNMFTPFSIVSIVDFEQISVSCVEKKRFSDDNIESVLVFLLVSLSLLY